MPKRWGADPEWFAGKGMEGCKYPKGRQPVRAPYGSRAYGEVGLDGDGFTGEFRPRPADTIAGLTFNVARCVGQLTYDRHPNGGYPLLHVAPPAWARNDGIKAAGGHVHIAWKESEPWGTNVRGAVTALAKVAEFVDGWYPGKSLKGRREGHYGARDAYRGVDWMRPGTGGWQATEYRGYNTWVAAPSLTYAVLKLTEATMKAGRALTADEMVFYGGIYKTMPRPCFWYDMKTQWWQVREKRDDLGIDKVVDAFGDSLSEADIVMLAAKKPKLYFYGLARTRGARITVSRPGDSDERFGDVAGRMSDWWAIGLPAARRESDQKACGIEAAGMFLAALRQDR
jgi:hypothetical protein